MLTLCVFFFSSRRRHTRLTCDWSSDVCSSDLAERVPLERVRGPIIELQEGRCFYCAERLARRAGQTPDVDHFIPWSRYPDDGLENLVVAHARCNAQKRDFLAAAAQADHGLSPLSLRSAF